MAKNKNRPRREPKTLKHKPEKETADTRPTKTFWNTAGRYQSAHSWVQTVVEPKVEGKRRPQRKLGQWNLLIYKDGHMKLLRWGSYSKQIERGKDHGEIQLPRHWQPIGNMDR